MQMSENPQSITRALIAVADTVPMGIEVHFFWRDGVQYMAIHEPGSMTKEVCFIRQSDGAVSVQPVYRN